MNQLQKEKHVLCIGRKDKVARRVHYLPQHECWQHRYPHNSDTHLLAQIENSDGNLSAPQIINRKRLKVVYL